MSNVQDAYCAVEDMRTGDIAEPIGTSREQYIKNAAEEIEAALGHLYVTPFVIDANVAKNRPTILYLKKLNWLLASGRYILDVAAAGESDNLHALGKRYLDEATAMLKVVVGGDPTLEGAVLIDTGRNENRGPVVLNEDSVSLVEQFYVGRRPFTPLAESWPGMPAPVKPYG